MVKKKSAKSTKELAGRKSWKPKVLSPILLEAVSLVLSSLHKLLLIDLSSLDITDLLGLQTKDVTLPFYFIFSLNLLSISNNSITLGLLSFFS